MANIGLNVAYFFFQRRFMMNATVNLISWKRILGCFLLQVMFSDNIAKKLYADNYYVNLNTLLDQDDDFLYESAEFRRIIKTVKTNHDYLLNPNFDISVECKLPALPLDTNLWHPPTMIEMYKPLFNVDEHPMTPFVALVQKYDNLFEPWQ